MPDLIDILYATMLPAGLTIPTGAERAYQGSHKVGVSGRKGSGNSGTALRGVEGTCRYLVTNPCVGTTY